MQQASAEREAGVLESHDVDVEDGGSLIVLGGQHVKGGLDGGVFHLSILHDLFLEKRLLRQQLHCWRHSCGSATAAASKKGNLDVCPNYPFVLREFSV